MKLLETYIDYCWAINCESDRSKRHDLEQERIGFTRALNKLGIMYGCEGDMEFISKGIDRPMCCGVLLDIEENGCLNPRESYLRGES